MTDRGTKVYVGGLGESIKKEDLEEEFEKFGKLNSVWVALNPPGFAFIEFSNLGDAETACDNMNGIDFLGSKLKVELARPKRRSGPPGGRGGGFRSFGGGGGGGGYNRFSRDSGGSGGGGGGGGRFQRREYGNGRSDFNSRQGGGRRFDGAGGGGGGGFRSRSPMGGGFNRN